MEVLFLSIPSARYTDKADGDCAGLGNEICSDAGKRSKKKTGKGVAAAAVTPPSYRE